MARTLLTSETEFDAAIDQLLQRAQTRLDIFDHNLVALKLDRPERIAQLQRLLGAPAHRLRIIVQDGARVLSGNPRLLKLLDEHQHHFALIQAADSVLELTDCMLIADNEHALIRFHRDQPRGKLLENDPAEAHPYVIRMGNIVEEGGHPLSARVAGL